MKDILMTLLWLWQAPQHILAYIIYKRYFKWILPAKSLDYSECSGYLGGVIIYVLHRACKFDGVSLGNYIFINDRYSKEMLDTKAHEWGHSVQSRILGPLYLLVIGLPSLILNIVSRYNRAAYNDYYNFPCEKWADKIGMVHRKQVFPKRIFADHFVLWASLHIAVMTGIIYFILRGILK